MNYITNFNAITSRETDRVASYPTKSVQSDFEVSGNNILHIRCQALQYAFYVHLFSVAGKHNPLVPCFHITMQHYIYKLSRTRI